MFFVKFVYIIENNFSSLKPNKGLCMAEEKQSTFQTVFHSKYREITPASLILGFLIGSFMTASFTYAGMVLGFSMGGCVAMQLALDRPELVRRLVLVSTLPSWRGPYPPCEALNRLFHRTDVCEELLVEVYEVAFGKSYRKRAPAKDYVAERMNDEFPQTVDSYLGQLAALESFDVRGQNVCFG